MSNDQPLVAALARGLDLAVQLDLAIAMVGAIASLHERGGVHRQLQPSQIRVDVPTRRVWLSDERDDVVALPYMAPEQTGRMSRAVDARSDLYALGVVLYEMLAARLPWSAATPAEWVHSHVARRPAPMPDGVPPGLAAIVERLLAKSPDERYQTATGLQADLVHARDLLRAGAIPRFALGEHDVPQRLRVPEQLYGRDDALASLAGAIDRAATTGVPELVLVYGPSGIGKSALVDELQRTHATGWFCAGKYDQYKRDIPYATLASALADLVRQVLRLPSAELERWRAAVRAAVGDYARLALEVVPAFALLLDASRGEPAIESKSRVHQTLADALTALASVGGSLALFIDDLQWSDHATLELLRYFFERAGRRSVVVVGAYRDNELAAHPALVRTLDDIRALGPVVSEIHLGPLAPDAYAALLAGMLGSDDDLSSLAAVVHDKTGGNPFFAIHFVSALVEDGLLRFHAGRWHWELAAIRARGLTRNVVDLLIATLQRLSDALRDAVIALACLGTEAPSATLASLLGISADVLDAMLAPAVRLGLIEHVADGYRFAHDRVQEAAHRLASPDERAQLHLAIARLLRTRSDGDAVFELASHYNDAAGLVDDADERGFAAEVNLSAAERARASGAYAAATAYIRRAQAFLGDDAWRATPALAARVELVAAYCDHLEARLEDAARRLALLADRVDDLIMLAEIARARGEVAFARGLVPESLEACVGFLRRAGIAWPAPPTPETVRAEYERMLALLGDRAVEDLVSHHDVTDPLLLACSNVLLAMVSPAGVTADRAVMGMTLLRMVTFALEHGMSPSAAVAFARVPEILVVSFNDWERAMQFGRLTNVVVGRPMFAEQRGRVYVTSAVTADPTVMTFAEIRTKLGVARQLAFTAGDVTYHNIAIINELSMAIAAGEPVARLVREGREGVAIVDRSGFDMMRLAMCAETRFVERMAGEAVTVADPVAMLRPGARLGALTVRVRDMLAASFLGDHAEAVAMIAEVEPIVALAAMRPQAQDFHFAAALSLLALGQLDAARRHVQRFLAWGAHANDNYRARMCLIEAEVARLEQRTADAGRLYDEATTWARAQAMPHNEGLASEAAERFYVARGLRLAARTYRDNGRRAWARWGAYAKLRRLDPAAMVAARPDDPRDLARVASLAQAVTSEIDLDRLAIKLLELAIAEGDATGGRVVIVQGAALISLAEASRGPIRIQRQAYVASELAARAIAARELVHDAAQIALPFVNQGRLVGLLLLEADQPFALARLSMLSTLAGLSAIALEHARLYSELRIAETHRAEAERLSRTGSLGWAATGEMAWSDEARAIYGYARDAAPSLIERIHPDDRDRVARDLEHARRDARDWTTSYRVVLPDLAQRHVHLQLRASGSELSGVLVDITDARRLEDGLEASRRHFATMLASIADGVVVADDADRVTFLNRAAEALTGWTQVQAIGQPYATVVCRRGDELVRRDGSRVPLDERRAALLDDARSARGMVSVIRDATEQREAARAESLALANERIELALLGSGVGLWRMPLVDGNVPLGGVLPMHTLNLWESFGWSTRDDDIVDGVRAPHPERLHPDDRLAMRQAFYAHACGETPAIAIEIRIRHAAGHYRWALVRGALVRDANGKPSHLTGTTVDVTERRALEHDIRRARDEAEAANNAKDEFLANVSHEVRTPMNAILGMTELALSTSLTAQQRLWLATVKSSTDNLLVLIDELLDYSKAEANKLELAHEPFSVRDLIDDTLRALGVRAQRKRVALVGDVDASVPAVLIGDRTRLYQILSNLVGNAIKFTSVGKIEVRVHMAGDELVIAVHDTGIGIAKDKHAHVFEPFAQEDASTTRRFGGTGLGLTIAARLAALMKGRIDLDSEPGQGSTFTVHVQLARSTSALKPKLDEPGVAGRGSAAEWQRGVVDDAAAPRRALRILVGEDNELNADLVRELLTRRGHEVVVAVDGHAALALANTDRFDLLLLDLHMPGIDGFEVVRGIRERERETTLHLPVVALTARSRREDRERCLASGMDDFLSKPLQSKLMFETIERLTVR